MRLGHQIRLARERAGHSPFSLGVAVGLPETDILAYEAGRRSVSMPRLRAIALACNTSSAELLANSHPLTGDLDWEEWLTLGTLFLGMSPASRSTLLQMARQLHDADDKA